VSTVCGRERRTTRVQAGGIAVAGLVVVLCPVAARAQPKPPDGVSIRAELTIEEMLRRAAREDWVMRHNGPWLNANDRWTNAAGVTSFPANTEYWLVAVIDECVGCTFEVRFFDEEAGGYFPLTSILSVESDGSVVTATGRFEVDHDTRGELYLQMLEPDLYPSYVILAQVR